MTECVSVALEEDRSATKETLPSLRHNRQGGCYNARKLKFEHHLFPLNITNPRSVPAKFVSYSQTDRPIQHQITTIPTTTGLFCPIAPIAQAPPLETARLNLDERG